MLITADELQQRQLIKVKKKGAIRRHLLSDAEPAQQDDPAQVARARKLMLRRAAYAKRMLDPAYRALKAKNAKKYRDPVKEVARVKKWVTANLARVRKTRALRSKRRYLLGQLGVLKDRAFFGPPMPSFLKPRCPCGQFVSVSKLSQLENRDDPIVRASICTRCQKPGKSLRRKANDMI